MRSINYLRDKIKGWGTVLDNYDFVVVLTVIFVGFASFGLGRLSKTTENYAEIKQKTLAEICTNKTEENVVAGQVVASKSGSKYHFPWCSGAQTIAENNKVWFNSVEEAKKAGYEPAKNCKGLE